MERCGAADSGLPTTKRGPAGRHFETVKTSQTPPPAVVRLAQCQALQAPPHPAPLVGAESVRGTHLAGSRALVSAARPSTLWHGGPLRCAPPTAPLRGPPPSPPNRASPSVRLQLSLDKSWGQRQARSYLKATDTRSGSQACRCPATLPAPSEETECWK